jgi:hypothetical protein
MLSFKVFEDKTKAMMIERMTKILLKKQRELIHMAMMSG